MRRYLAICLLATVVVMTGCAPATDAGSTPSPSPSSASPSPSSPSPSPLRTPSPTPTPTPTVETFTEEQLVDLCVETMRSAFDPDVIFGVESARVEQRQVDPPWLVLIPAQTLGYDSQALCTIGGTPQAPEFELANASLTPMSEEAIQGIIDGTYDFGGE